jgi:hypothetical protein
MGEGRGAVPGTRSGSGGTRGLPQGVAAVAFLGALVVNVLANRLPLGGRSTGELSALYPNLFVPAGVTFSIWGLIYLLVAAWTVAQFLPSRADLGRTLAPAFALSSGLNAAWLFAWHGTRVGLSVGIMLGLLAVLIRINVLLRDANPPAPVLPRLAFGIYLGWVLVATLVNVTAFLVSVGWEGGGIPATAWAALLVLVGAAVAVVTLRRLRTSLPAVAVVWAFGGIALNRWDDVPLVAWTAVGMMVLVAAAALALAVRSPHSGGESPTRRKVA